MNLRCNPYQHPGRYIYHVIHYFFYIISFKIYYISSDSNMPKSTKSTIDNDKRTSKYIEFKKKAQILKEKNEKQEKFLAALKNMSKIKNSYYGKPPTLRVKPRIVKKGSKDLPYTLD